MQVAIPQVRGAVEFYPSALERGVSSECALKLAYVQEVSTRKVTAVMQQLCGLPVSSTQVSRATQLPEEELGAWRDRPLGQYRYLFLQFTDGSTWGDQDDYVISVMKTLRRVAKVSSLELLRPS